MSIQSQIDKANQRIGKQYGYLTIISRDGSDKFRRATFLCRCICGKEVIKSTDYLSKVQGASCGCKCNELRAAAQYKHGQSTRAGSTRLYEVWKGIVARCTNPNNKAYKYYGGKGIKVCDEWRQFETFYADMGEIPFDTAQVDRIDPNGNYEKSNCRWLSQKENILRSK
jgi:hypothetical protein